MIRVSLWFDLVAHNFLDFQNPYLRNRLYRARDTIIQREGTQRNTIQKRLYWNVY